MCDKITLPGGKGWGRGGHPTHTRPACKLLHTRVPGACMEGGHGQGHLGGGPRCWGDLCHTCGRVGAFGDASGHLGLPGGIWGRLGILGGIGDPPGPHSA